MSKIISLKSIKNNSVGETFPIEKKTIAWDGGKITSNKKKIALKYIEKKKKNGEELSEGII